MPGAYLGTYFYGGEMDGFDAQKYVAVEKKLQELGMEMATQGALFWLKKGGETLGNFKSIAELHSFLCGYEAGRVAK